MRLYLSSQRLGAAPDALVALLRGGARVAVVANAADELEADARAARVEREAGDLAGLGLQPSELDLRGYFDEAERLRADLETYDAVWALGGNAIALRTAFYASGADLAVVERLEADSLVYAGYSAGACVLGPRGALRVTSPDLHLPGYPERSVVEGLGLLPFAIAPHFDDDPGSTGAGLAQHYLDLHIPVVALRDGQAIVVDGTDWRVVG